MVSTRPSNATKHPGVPDVKRTRRPASDVAAERLEAAEEQVAEGATQTRKIAHVAQLQNDTRQKELKRAKAGDVPSVVSQGKTTRSTASSSGAKSTSTLSGTPAASSRQSESTLLSESANDSINNNSQPARKSSQVRPGRVTVTEQRELLSGSGQQSHRKGDTTSSASGKGATVTSVSESHSGGLKRKAPADNDGAAASESVHPKSVPSMYPNDLKPAAKKPRAKAPSGIRPDWIHPSPGSTPTVKAPRKATTTRAKKPAPRTMSLPRAVTYVAREWTKAQQPAQVSTAQVNGSNSELGPPGEVMHGGYVSDEDDETAAPENNAVRTTAMGLVTITHKSSAPGDVKKARKRGVTRYTNEDLPLACRALWRKTYVPTLYDMYATGKDPWDNTANNTMLDYVTHVWKRVYSDLPISVEEIHGPILAVINQRLAEWRGKFATTAIDALTRFFDSDEQYSSPGSRAKFVKWALGPKKLFIWQTTTPKRRGAFQSRLVIETFASHISDISGTKDSFYKACEPQGALALTCVAIERALGFYKTGTRHVPERGESQFKADMWNDTTKSYLKCIKLLEAENWDAIVAIAEPYAKKGKGRQHGHSSSFDSDEDDRTRLLDSSDEDEDAAVHSSDPLDIRDASLELSGDDTTQGLEIDGPTDLGDEAASLSESHVDDSGRHSSQAAEEFEEYDDELMQLE
ncbi:uncharacterized protein B0H18DRAFT_952118 [Fomitopsis serialis]|uniref:uncharacterized protein n=1 Tax=Fomitopsis serialis TaxID=139415 RepID=UPI002007A77E|nr:uncharacterized protein B0H18DRAFT_952118 [Neoantrodia serialis]KAH9932966.1 hypothetical protein B0H18DRAFT_952118 [Neoantrodia serialis]